MRLSWLSLGIAHSGFPHSSGKKSASHCPTTCSNVHAISRPGGGAGGSHVLHRNQKQLAAGIRLLLHPTPPLLPGAHTSPQAIDSGEPTPTCCPPQCPMCQPQCANPKVLLVVLAVCPGPLPGRAPPQRCVGGSSAGPQLRVRGVFAGICHHLPKWLFSFLFPFNSNQS